MPIPSSSLAIRIYLEDTDAGGVVYHGSYVRFMERARTEWLRTLGLQQSTTFEENLSFVLHQLELRFERPARLDQQLEVTCSPAALGAATIVFEQQVRDAHSGEICCRGRATVACVQLQTLRPQRLPATLRAALGELPRPTRK